MSGHLHFEPPQFGSQPVNIFMRISYRLLGVLDHNFPIRSAAWFALQGAQTQGPGTRRPSRRSQSKFQIFLIIVAATGFMGVSGAPRPRALSSIFGGTVLFPSSDSTDILSTKDVVWVLPIVTSLVLRSSGPVLTKPSVWFFAVRLAVRNPWVIKPGGVLVASSE
ncbi:hypothetical protein H2248_008795 [Termitomyces sp. 'cryptogamus']|nr:hypothetical protein H2248_008795 [Termitomyces sp. 'cryptogamus']